MKKIITVLLCFTMMLVGSVVFADAAPPMLSYSVMVSNKNGATLYGYEYDSETDQGKLYENGTVPYGTSFTAYHIMTYQQGQYAYVYDAKAINGNGEGYISVKDLQKKTPWKMSDFSFNEYSKHHVTVVGEKEINIYEWPFGGEKIIGKIPVGTEIEVQGIYDDFTWYYTSYNGIQGWLNTTTNALGTKNNLNKQFVTNWAGAPLYNSEGNEIGRIDGNVSITDYYSILGDEGMYYLSYQDKLGYVRSWNVASSLWEEGQRYTVNYDDAVLIGLDDEISSIPRGTVLEYHISGTYYGEDCYSPYCLTNYLGKEGWVFYTHDWYVGNENEAEVYESEVNEIKLCIEQVKQEIEDKKNGILPEPIQEVTKNEEKVDKPSNMPEPTSVKSSDSLIIICVLCAVLASLVTLTLIILINKESDKKLLWILIPLILAVVVFGVMLWIHHQRTTKEEDTKEMNIVSNSVIEKNEEKAENNAIQNLRTDNTKNFFDVDYYAHANYKNDGMSFGYPELFQYDKNTGKYQTEIEFHGNVIASSTLASQGNFNYDVNNIVNGNRRNTWVEGVSGYGIGEFVEITQKNDTSSDVKLSEVCIVNGYAENNTKWQENSRVKVLKFYCDGKHIANIELMDTIAPQYIDVSPLNIVLKGNAERKLKFEISEIYEGEKYDDTAITGIIIK